MTARLKGQLDDGVERLQIEGDRRSLEVKVRYPHNSSGRRQARIPAPA